MSKEDYELFTRDNSFAKANLQKAYSNHPELFPLQFSEGFKLNAFERRA